MSLGLSQQFSVDRSERIKELNIREILKSIFFDHFRARIYCNHVTKCFLAPTSQKRRENSKAWHDHKAKWEIKTFEEYDENKIQPVDGKKIFKKLYRIPRPRCCCHNYRWEIETEVYLDQNNDWLKKREFYFMRKHCDKNALLRVFCLDV